MHTSITHTVPSSRQTPPFRVSKVLPSGQQRLLVNPHAAQQGSLSAGRLLIYVSLKVLVQTLGGTNGKQLGPGFQQTHDNFEEFTRAQAGPFNVRGFTRAQAEPRLSWKPRTIQSSQKTETEVKLCW